MFLTREMYNEVAQRDPRVLRLVPDQFVTQEMCNEAVERVPWMLVFVPAQYKTQEMCNESVKKSPEALEHVFDQYKTQEMCNEAVQRVPWMLVFVPDWFVMLQKTWHEDFGYDDVLSTWRDAYIKRKAQKTKIKEELMPVAWHPD